MKSRARRYYRRFNEFNPYWDDQDRKQNAMFVQMIQDRMNDLLRFRGYVSLNEVLKLLGFERDRWGDMIGWVRDPAPGEGDGYVDFGVWTNGFAEGRDWIRGKIDVKTLYFNVDDTNDPLTYRVRKLKAEGKI